MNRTQFIVTLAILWERYTSLYHFTNAIAKTIEKIVPSDRTVIVKKHNAANWDEKPDYYYSIYYDDPEMNWAVDLISWCSSLNKRFRASAYNGCTLHVYK